MEKQAIRMKILSEKNLKNLLNNQFCKPINVSIGDMDRFAKNKKQRKSDQLKVLGTTS